MFKRRKPKHVVLKVKNIMWPCMGWLRLLSYYKHRVGRMRGTPEMIAAGFASGVAVSFTPLMGLHFVLGIIVAMVVRGSLVASMFGTFFGNPWTFPIIWLLIYKLGLLILYGHTAGTEAMTALNLHDFMKNPKDILFPMMVGGIPCAIITWVLTYYVVRDAIDTYQKRRKRRLARKTMKAFRDSAK